MVGLGGANAGELVVGGRGRRVHLPRALHRPGQSRDLRHGTAARPDPALDRARAGAHGALHLGHAARATCGGWWPRPAATTTTGRPGAARRCASCWSTKGSPCTPRRRWRPGFDAADYFGYPAPPVSPAARDGGVPPPRGRARPRAERARAPAALSLGRHEPGRAAGGRAGASRSGPATTSGYRMTEALVAERGLAAAAAGAGAEFQAAEDVARGGSRRRRRRRRELPSHAHFPTQKLANTRSSTSSTSTAPISSSSARSSPPGRGARRARRRPTPREVRERVGQRLAAPGRAPCGAARG